MPLREEVRFESSESGEHARDQIGLFELNPRHVRKSNFRWCVGNSDKMGVGQRQPYLLQADVTDLDTEESQDLVEPVLIDDTEGMNLTNAGSELSPFHLR